MKFGYFAALALILTACAQTPSPPPEVLAEAKRILLTDTEWPEKGDEPVRWLKQKVLVPVQVTPASPTDWIINPGQSDQAGMLCGTGGCEIQIWSAAEGGAYKAVFASRVREFTPQHRDGEWRIHVDYHGSYCGLTGAEPCPFSYIWSPEERAFVADLPDNRLSLAPFPQALSPLRDAAVPAEIAALVSANRTACAKLGATFEANAYVSRLPDTNGDNIREWAWDGLYATCVSESGDTSLPDPCSVLTCENRIYVSQSRSGGGQEWVRAALTPKSGYGLKTCTKGIPEIVELASDDAVPANCDCSTQCGKKTLPPVPNTVKAS